MKLLEFIKDTEVMILRLYTMNTDIATSIEIDVYILCRNRSPFII